ncbi:MAG: energy-coupling factor transporter transmembrane component T [Coriobacteriia bacterium]|nr:energy-coupling factor transporter transmembrane component T [Coriobacteriia bacterium]
MLNQSFLGEYTALATPIHQLDARLKLIVLFSASISIFFIDTWFGMGIFALFVMILIRLAKLPIKAVVKGLKPVLIILSFMFLAQAFRVQAPYPILASFGFDPSGALRGIFYVLRILLLVALTLIVTFSTSKDELSSKLAWFLAFLRPLGVPVDDIVMMISIAIRFIPLTFAEFNQIVMAQKARGANFETGSIFRRLKAYIPVFIPLFVALFKKSYDLADAMDARLYQGRGRTQMNDERVSFAALTISLALCLALFVLAVVM